MMELEMSDGANLRVRGHWWLNTVNWLRGNALG